MRGEDIVTRQDDVIKANLLLAAIIGAFIVLTSIAYFLNEGRHHFVIPFLRKCYPTCKWVIQEDKLKNDNEEKEQSLGDLAHKSIHLGLRRHSEELRRIMGVE